jgi:hypothetical protein
MSVMGLSVEVFETGDVTLRGEVRVSDMTGLDAGAQALEQKNWPL